MEGAVALERSSLGRRPPEMEDREESLLDMLRRESGVVELMMSSSESEQ